VRLSLRPASPTRTQQSLLAAFVSFSLAGACPLDQTGAIVGVGDVQSQAEQVMSNLSLALEASGARLEDVVKTTVYVASDDRADLVAAWDVVRRHFGRHDAPSTLVGVTMLGYEGQLVEVEAVAALP